jgi:hypothetical protein
MSHPPLGISFGCAAIVGAMETIKMRHAVAAALAATGALHLILAPEYLSEQAYIGVLFVLGGITSIGLATAVWLREDARAIAAGAAVAAGMAVSFVLSRTTGLPGFHESEWEASGLLSVLLEAFVVVGAWELLRGVPLRRQLAG